MKALSLTRPWHLCILCMGKRIENRSDKRGMPPMCKYRGPLLLHAAKSWDPTVLDFLRENKLDDEIARSGLLGALLFTSRKMTDTGIVGRCRVVGAVEPMGSYTNDDRWPDGETVGWDIADSDSGFEARWWMGGHGLLLDDVEALDEPIPCRGRLGLWTVPDDVLERLPEGWRP